MYIDWDNRYNFGIEMWFERMKLKKLLLKEVEL